MLSPEVFVGKKVKNLQHWDAYVACRSFTFIIDGSRDITFLVDQDLEYHKPTYFAPLPIPPLPSTRRLRQFTPPAQSSPLRASVTSEPL